MSYAANGGPPSTVLERGSRHSTDLDLRDSQCKIAAMKLWMATLALLPACGFNSPKVGDGGTEDGNDSGTPDAQACFGSFPKVCFTSSANVPALPPPLPDLPVVDIDTSSTSICDQNNDQASSYCVVVGNVFTIATGKLIRAYGPKPLVLLSTTTFQLLGEIDVSSTSGILSSHPIGAGASSPDLGTACGNGASAATINSGGFGGSFGGKGGNGKQTDGTRGAPAPASGRFPDQLRAGCPGGAGAGTGAGTGGNGGGAVTIIGTVITLAGKINASGASGHGGSVNSKCGGGGGGSGGMIVLDATSIVPSGSPTLYANGGGGGQGGQSTLAGQGKDGGESTGPAAVGMGGNNGMSTGGGGGNGAFGTTNRDGDDAANAVGSDGGGGGGGGGAGVIHAPGITMNIAPPSTDP
jgi:hypothetical protein